MPKSDIAKVKQIDRILRRLDNRIAEMAQQLHTLDGPGTNLFNQCGDNCRTCRIERRLYARRMNLRPLQQAALKGVAQSAAKQDTQKATYPRSVIKRERRYSLAHKIAKLDIDMDDVTRAEIRPLRAWYQKEHKRGADTFRCDMQALGYSLK